MSPTYAWLFLLVVFVLLLPYAKPLEEMRRRGRTLTRIETKLDLLLQHAGIEFEPYKDLPAEVVDALKRDQKIAAIKAYRAISHVGLREAKERIEDAQRRAGT